MSNIVSLNPKLHTLAQMEVVLGAFEKDLMAAMQKALDDGVPRMLIAALLLAQGQRTMSETIT